MREVSLVDDDGDDDDEQQPTTIGPLHMAEMTKLPVFITYIMNGPYRTHHVENRYQRVNKTKEKSETGST